MSENVEELDFEYDDMEHGGFAEGGEGEGEEEDGFSLLGSSDDAEQQRMYMEYLALIKDINCQNKMVAEIKAQLAKLCAKDCKTRCEIKNIKRLHNCMEQENLKLQCLIKKAITLQNFGSKRHYKAIAIETTVDEDNLSPYVGAIPPTGWKPNGESSSDPCDPCAASSSGPCSSLEDSEDFVTSMLKSLKKMKVTCPEDKKIIKQIATTLMGKKPCGGAPKPRPCDPCRSQRSGGDFMTCSMPCEKDSVDVLRKKVCCIQAVMNKLKQEIAGKERERSSGMSGPSPPSGGMVDRLRKRLCSAQSEIHRLQQEIARKQRESDCGASSSDGGLKKLKKQLCSMQGTVRKIRDEISNKENSCQQDGQLPCSDSLEKLREKICRMQAVMNGINNEIARRESDCAGMQDQDYGQDEMSPCDEDMDPMLVCSTNKNTKGEQLRRMKENYLHLLSEFAKKDNKLKELEQRLRGYCGRCDGGSKSGTNGDDDAEVELLRCRINELREEQDEFKCIMKEQAQQLEDYRQKYLTAQQKVEEQNAALEKLNMNNKRIEKQINTEVKEIRAKFQEKLNELLQYPKLLENEQCKLSQVSKEKDELQAKLAIICKELRNMKSKQEEDRVEDCRPQLTKCTIELEQTKVAMEELQRQRDLLCEELQKVKDDLDTLRCESAKIIARTKERADQMKQQQQDQIDRLERELAQCRATACLSVSDREAVIREMQGQLNTLSFSFDAAQKQIKTLRNHIAFVSNENCFPIKC